MSASAEVRDVRALRSLVRACWRRLDANDQRDVLVGFVRTETEATRTDDWESGQTQGHGAGGLFESGGGDGGSTGGDSGSSSGSATGQMGLPPHAHDPLAGIARRHLYSWHELQNGGVDYERAEERQALARVMELPLLDAKLEARARAEEDSAFYDEDAEAVKNTATSKQADAVNKFSFQHDHTMRRLDAGDDESSIARDVEERWDEKLNGMGVDVDEAAESEGDGDTQLPGLANLYYEHFNYESGEEHVEACARALEHIDQMFEDVAPTPGIAYRGLKNIDAETIQKIIDSKTYTVDSLSSFTARHSVAEDFTVGIGQDLNHDLMHPAGYSVILRVKHESGINIMAMSQIETEREILIKKDTKFRIVGVKREKYSPGSGRGPLVVMDLEEIPADVDDDGPAHAELPHHEGAGA